VPSSYLTLFLCPGYASIRTHEKAIGKGIECK
jgi:hypothetical protein